MDVLLFPRTEPDTQLMRSLRTVFDGVTCLRPLEDDGASVASTATDCRRIAPAPLGEDRPRFLRMLRDLRAHPDEYYEGFLRSLSETASGHCPVPVEDLIADFTRQGGAGAQEEKERRETLWQARLLLALAETVEEEEAAVAAGLAAVEARERELLASLHGETDLPDDEDMDFHRDIPPAPPAMTSEVPTAQRCLAWAQLYLLLAEAPWPAFAVTSPEALSWLSGQYEKKTRTTPVEIGRWPLPGGAPDEAGEARDIRNDRREEPGEALAGLLDLLEKTAAGHETAETATAAFGHLAARWTQALVTRGQRPGGGGTLRFLLFPDQSLRATLTAALRQAVPVSESAALRQGLAVFWERP